MVAFGRAATPGRSIDLNLTGDSIRAAPENRFAWLDELSDTACPDYAQGRCLPGVMDHSARFVLSGMASPVKFGVDQPGMFQEAEGALPRGYLSPTALKVPQAGQKGVLVQGRSRGDTPGVGGRLKMSASGNIRDVPVTERYPMCRGVG